MTDATKLSPALIDRVVAALGFAQAPAPDFAGLRALYHAWCRGVPFDNLRKRIHLARGLTTAFPGDGAEDFFEAWLRYRTGGTCWAGNGALCTLLQALGFPARRGVATMLARPNIPPNHGTVLVEYDTGLFVVDASMLHSEPLRLDEQAETVIEHPAWGVRAGKRDGHWYIRWRPLNLPGGLECRIDRIVATAEEFSERHEMTRPWGGFNFEIHARRISGDSMLGTCLAKRVEFDARGAVVERGLDREAQRRFLIDELGISEAIVAQLPADTPTPPPPGSRTAQAAAKR
ncbi:MAG TPA: arylamine N-acetyltransferase [Steroidobacteraceae bacterium]|nr:arylamine N-acetyltransferase [Steroidobacteraceae bacterium]